MRLSAIWPPLLTGAALFFAFGCFPASEEPSLRILFNSSKPVSAYDPAAASLAQHYLFLENVFSPLLEYSGGDKLVSGMASSFEWAGSEARFTMRGGLRTAGGQKIDAYDAEFSLKRAFVLGGQDYDLLRELLCGREEIKKVSDPCPNLRVLDGGRTLSMKFEEKKTFLFHLLTNIAYAVIPKGSVDQETLAIADFASTSGPYYVASDQGGGLWELRANPRHYRYSPDMPQGVKAVPLLTFMANDKAMGMLTNGEIDYMISGLVRTPDDKAAFVSENPGYNINFTQPVRIVYVVFTDRGMKRLTRAERFFIAARMREVYLAGRPSCEAPAQVFRMEGALTKEQLASMNGLLSGAGDARLEKKISGRGVPTFFWREGDSLKPRLPGLAEAGKGEEPDFFMNSGDIGFQDDVGLVLYFLKLEFFELAPAAKAEWLRRYLTAPDKKTRVGLLRDLHYRTLVSGRVLPVALMPYASVARKPWKFNFPAMCGGDQFWRLRKK